MNQLPNNTTLNPQKASLFDKIGIGVNHNFDLEVINANHGTPAEEVENDIYFYHTDHLGSSSWITYTDGSVTQHMQNLPFGEPFIDQRATSYDIRYKFTGKEMDTETDYQYFGARYYNSNISVWLSVDPLSDKYPSMSSYMYTSGNPVMLVDPDGRSISIFDEDGKFIETKKDNWFHNTFVGRKGRVIDGEGNTLQKFKFNDYENDKDKLIKGEKVLDLNFESKVDEMIDDGAKSINEYVDRYKEDGDKHPKLKGVKDGVTLGEADYMDIKKDLRYENDKIFLVDGIGYNNYDLGNFLTGAAVKKLNTISQLTFRIGAHINNHINGNINNSNNPNFKPQKGIIRFDSRADQKAIRNGFRYQRKKQ